MNGDELIEASVRLLSDDVIAKLIERAQKEQDINHTISRILHFGKSEQARRAALRKLDP